MIGQFKVTIFAPDGEIFAKLECDEILGVTPEGHFPHRTAFLLRGDVAADTSLPYIVEGTVTSDPPYDPRYRSETFNVLLFLDRSEPFKTLTSSHD